jgi:hypothetical protein
VVAAARAVLGESVLAVLIAGSHAAGRSRPGSDVNALIVARDLPPAAERRRLARQVARRALWDAELRLSAQLLGEGDLDPTDPALAQGVQLAWGGGPAVDRFLRSVRDRYRFDQELGTWTWSPPS